MQELAHVLDDPAVAAGHKRIAGQLAAIARSQAPVGPTGSLREAIISGAFPQRRGGRIPAGFVSVQHNIAPHLHLVHDGTGPRQDSQGRNLGAVPPNPFLHRAASIGRPLVKAGLTALYTAEIKKAAVRAAALGKL